MTNSGKRRRDAVIRGGAWRRGLTFEPAELAAIRQPLLYVIGTADPEGTVAYAERLVGIVPTAELSVVPDGGHMPWLDYATRVGNTIRTFLTSS